MKLVYPAIFMPYESRNGGYTAEFPDLPGCVTGGSDLAEAIYMAIDAASGWILGEIERGKVIPEPSDITNIKCNEGGLVSLIALDMDTYAEKYGKKAVKKTLTIPAWMNTVMTQPE